MFRIHGLQLIGAARMCNIVWLKEVIMSDKDLGI